MIILSHIFFLTFDLKITHIYCKKKNYNIEIHKVEHKSHTLTCHPEITAVNNSYIFHLRSNWIRMIPFMVFCKVLFFHLICYSHVTMPGQSFSLFNTILPSHRSPRGPVCTSSSVQTLSGSWIESNGPNPGTESRLIGATIPVLNMTTYSTEGIMSV